MNFTRARYIMMVGASPFGGDSQDVVVTGILFDTKSQTPRKTIEKITGPIGIDSVTETIGEELLEGIAGADITATR
ncbi:MAG: hypothetical protein AAF417_15095 [Pseudomonadota bacterium]